MRIFLLHSVVCGSAKFVGRLGWTEKKLGAPPSTQSESLHNNQNFQFLLRHFRLDPVGPPLLVIAVASDLGGISPGLRFGDPYCNCV